MKPEIKVGKYYLCKDGRIRKVLDIKPAKRWRWEKRILTEIVYGKIGRTKRNHLNMNTMMMYAIAEVPEAYSTEEKLKTFPAVYALKQALVEIDSTMGKPSDILIYRALAYARESGFKAGIRDGFEYPHAMIELPTGTIEFLMEPYRAFKLPTIVENQQRINQFLEGVEA